MMTVDEQQKSFEENVDFGGGMNYSGSIPPIVVDDNASHHPPSPPSSYRPRIVFITLTQEELDLKEWVYRKSRSVTLDGIIPVCLFGILVNLVALCYLWRRTKKGSTIRIFLVFLATFDVLQLVFSMPLGLIYVCNNHEKQQENGGEGSGRREKGAFLRYGCLHYHDWGRLLLENLSQTIDTAHMWLIVAITIHRFWKIKYPFHSHIHDTPSRAYLVIGGVVISAVIFRIPAYAETKIVFPVSEVVVGDGNRTTNAVGMSNGRFRMISSGLLNSATYNTVYYTVLNAALFSCIPLVTLTLLNAMIIRSLIAARSAVRKESIYRNRETRAAVTICVIVSLFILFHVTFLWDAVMLSLKAFGGGSQTGSSWLSTDYHRLTEYGDLIGKINVLLSTVSSTVNPFVYVAIGSSCRLCHRALYAAFGWSPFNVRRQPSTINNFSLYTNNHSFNNNNSNVCAGGSLQPIPSHRCACSCSCSSCGCCSFSGNQGAAAAAANHSSSPQKKHLLHAAAAAASSSSKKVNNNSKKLSVSSSTGIGVRVRQQKPRFSTLSTASLRCYHHHHLHHNHRRRQGQGRQPQLEAPASPTNTNAMSPSAIVLLVRTTGRDETPRRNDAGGERGMNGGKGPKDSKKKTLLMRSISSQHPRTASVGGSSSFIGLNNTMSQFDRTHLTPRQSCAIQQPPSSSSTTSSSIMPTGSNQNNSTYHQSSRSAAAAAAARNHPYKISKSSIQQSTGTVPLTCSSDRRTHYAAQCRSQCSSNENHRHGGNRIHRDSGIMLEMTPFSPTITTEPQNRTTTCDHGGGGGGQQGESSRQQQQQRQQRGRRQQQQQQQQRHRLSSFQTTSFSNPLRPATKPSNPGKKQHSLP